jgi:hypothetical protein
MQLLISAAQLLDENQTAYTPSFDFKANLVMSEYKLSDLHII